MDFGSCNCTPQERNLVLGLVALLLLAVGLAIGWMLRRQQGEGALERMKRQSAGHPRYHVTANHLVYEVRTREVVYRAASAAEAYGWVETMSAEADSM